MLLGLVVLGGSSTAFAHDPIILIDTQTTPDAGPLLPDGTISFALYGTLDAAGDTRGLRVQFDAGDHLDLTLLIPDLAPENELPDSLLPTLAVIAPDGTSRILTATEHVPFDESFSHTSYVRYLELAEPAQAGEYRLTVTGVVPARFTLAVGTNEVFGTPVENVPNRGDGAAGVQRWYATPPPASVANERRTEHDDDHDHDHDTRRRRPWRRPSPRSPPTWRSRACRHPPRSSRRQARPGPASARACRPRCSVH